MNNLYLSVCLGTLGLHLLMPCLGFLHVLMADTGLQSFLYFPCLILVLGYIRNHQAYRLSPLKDPAINITCKFDRPHFKNSVIFDDFRSLILMECYGLNVCVPSKYMLKSNPKGDVIRRWSLGRYLS